MVDGCESRADDHLEFREALAGLLRGDFSRLAPLFEDQPSEAGDSCRIIKWYKKGCFHGEAPALAEALTCACFLGRTRVASFLISQRVNPSGGCRTGLNAFHWAANRGQLETVKMLIAQGVPLEEKNMYGGTVLGTAVWSAVHEPKPHHLAIIETLLRAGARLDGITLPSGDERVDDLLRRYL